jgi:hypothetical protein
MIVGGLLLLSPFIGLFGTVIGMMGAFKTLSGPGISDPNALSASIGTTLISTAAGLFLFPVGLGVLAISIVFFVRTGTAVPPPIPPGGVGESPQSQIGSVRTID